MESLLPASIPLAFPLLSLGSVFPRHREPYRIKPESEKQTVQQTPSHRSQDAQSRNKLLHPPLTATILPVARLSPSLTQSLRILSHSRCCRPTNGCQIPPTAGLLPTRGRGRRSFGLVFHGFLSPGRSIHTLTPGNRSSCLHS